MYLTTELLLKAVPALEEADKAMSTSAAADQLMIGQTDILFTMGFQDKSLMQAGFNAYNTALGGFKTDMMSIVSGFQKGTYTYTQAMDRWNSITKDYYVKMFSAGTKAIGNPFYEKMGLTRKDLTFINGARRYERRFMSKLLMDIDNPKHIPRFHFPKGHPYAKLPPYLQRGLAYAESGKAQFMNGMLAGAGSRMDIYWVLGVPQLEHCDVCPVYASRKWTWQSLPTVPRAGGTPCLFRCYCILEFKPRHTARGFDLAGKATEGALRAPGRHGRVFDSAGREMGGELQARVEDAYARMYKARQMMLATKGEAQMEWVRARIVANREIIEMTAAGKYRTVPTVSVRALTETMKSAMAKGGTLIDDIMKLGVGDEIVLVSADFSGVGTISIRGGRLVYKSPSGMERVITSETDITFLLKKIGEAETPFATSAVSTAKYSLRKLDGGVNKAYKTTLTNGEIGVYKPKSGEYSHAKSVVGGDLYKREQAAYEIAKAMGWDDLVPETVVKKGPHGIGSVQKWVTGKTPDEVSKLVMRRVKEFEHEQLFAFDTLIANADRHGGNLFITPGSKIKAIDNGYSLHVNKAKASTTFRPYYEHEKYFDSIISPQVKDAMKKLLENKVALKAKLYSLGLEKRAIDLMFQRAKSLSGRLPKYYKSSIFGYED